MGLCFSRNTILQFSDSNRLLVLKIDWNKRSTGYQNPGLSAFAASVLVGSRGSNLKLFDKQFWSCFILQTSQFWLANRLCWFDSGLDDMNCFPQNVDLSNVCDLVTFLFRFL